MPVISRDYWVSEFFGNSLYLVAFGYYFVITFLGYNGSCTSSYYFRVNVTDELRQLYLSSTIPSYSSHLYWSVWSYGLFHYSASTFPRILRRYYGPVPTCGNKSSEIKSLQDKRQNE